MGVGHGQWRVALTMNFGNLRNKDCCLARDSLNWKMSCCRKFHRVLKDIGFSDMRPRLEQHQGVLPNVMLHCGEEKITQIVYIKAGLPKFPVESPKGNYGDSRWEYEKNAGERCIEWNECTPTLQLKGKDKFIDIHKGNLTVFQIRAPSGINAACNCFYLGTTGMPGR